MIESISASESFNHKVSIISGVRTEDDVMRGEETKLIGCTDAAFDESEHLFIFPGTHPKHVNVKNSKAIAFKTYMTGEFFDLLWRKSILSVSVEEDEDLQNTNNLKAFKKGVKDSIDSNILHTCFLVRTNNVFNKLTKHENYYYLSGLLIGTELKDVKNLTNTNLTIVGNEAITPYYTTAFNVIGLPAGAASPATQQADGALIKGQLKIYLNT
jgi:2-dehydro-3-deoxygalactonokinase